MNTASVLIQGPAVTVMNATTMALLAEPPLWKRRMEVDNYINFPTLEETLLQAEDRTDKAMSLSLQGEIHQHLKTLQNSS
jgi:hypothetical protein